MDSFMGRLLRQSFLSGSRTPGPALEALVGPVPLWLKLDNVAGQQSEEHTIAHVVRFPGNGLGGTVGRLCGGIITAPGAFGYRLARGTRGAQKVIHRSVNEKTAKP
ncbi:hypothetical protein SRHO_G00268160 [Serrasalmus rhombeus]